jgi:hypothetical protein
MRISKRIKKIENNKKLLGGYIALFAIVVLFLFVYSFKHNIAGRSFCFGNCGSSSCALGNIPLTCEFIFLGLILLFIILVFLILRNKKQ